MIYRRRLMENIFSLALLQALNYGAPLITIPYLVRVLQPSTFGLLAFAQGIVLYFDFFTDFGFNFSATRAIATSRDDLQEVSRLFWSTLTAKALLMCTSVLGLTLLVLLTPKLRETPVLFEATGLYLIGTTLFPIWLFQGLERLKLAATLFGLARLLTIPALFLLVKHPKDYVIAAAIQASVEFTASILAWPLVIRRIGLAWHRPSVLEVTKALTQAWPLFLSTAALQLSTSSITVILGFARSEAEVGYFSAADKLIKASGAALSPLTQALFPHFAASRVHSPHSTRRLIRKSMLVMGVAGLIVSVVVAHWAGPVCRFTFGNSFVRSVPVLEALSPLPLLLALQSVCGMQMLIFKMDSALAKIMLLCAILSIAIAALLSLSYGALGAAAASVITAAVSVLAILYALSTKRIPAWNLEKG